MLYTIKGVSCIVPRISAIVLAFVLGFTACTNEQGEARRVIGTGDEGEHYEMNEGHDSTVSGNAVTSALKADTAADADALIENSVREKMDTSESYSSINGRTSTSNKGASVSNGGTTTGSLQGGQQRNQTPPPGSNRTTTGETVPVRPTEGVQSGNNQIRSGQTGTQDRSGTQTPTSGSNNRSNQ